MTARPVQLRHVGTTPDGVDLWACVVCQRPSTRDKAPGGRRHHRGLPRIIGHGMCGKCWVAAKRHPQPDRSPAVPSPALAAFDWQAAAACAGNTDPAFITETRGEREPWDRRRTAARRYCAGCSVIQACAEFADRDHMPGLWAGAWRSNEHSNSARPTHRDLLDGNAPPHRCDIPGCTARQTAAA